MPTQQLPESLNRLFVAEDRQYQFMKVLLEDPVLSWAKIAAVIASMLPLIGFGIYLIVR